MIEKVRDLKEISLNNQDVMIKASLTGKKTSLLLPDDMAQETKDELKGEWTFVIVAIGKEVEAFRVGQIASMKQAAGAYHLEDSSDPDSSRFMVLHMNSIEFATNPSNYKA